VSEDGANRCGCCAVVIRAIPVPSWIRGWFAPIAETPLAIPNALFGPLSGLFLETAVAGPTERVGELVSCLIGLEKLLSLHVTDWNFHFCVFAFSRFPQKAFVGDFNFFCFTTSVFPLVRFGAAPTYLGSECFSIFSLEVEDMQERDGKIPPPWVSCFCVLVPPKKNFWEGVKNLTVKSILWRGSAYRFLPCPFNIY